MSGNADAVASRRHLAAAKPTSKQSGPAPQKLALVGAKASTKFSVVVTGKGKAAVTTQVIQVTKGATAGTIVRSASTRPVATCPPLCSDDINHCITWLRQYYPANCTQFVSLYGPPCMYAP